ncbi:hypothetical protein RO3G_02926 [Rhizopus delemar RA 99-880]|uniref:Uncharacterized protein n=1 Tax=Rhizopus delemar (strain RA 99-880 / ATCC MYA-4621 / FGSC 9543 / NRRL 43880) TaxID=246409 RepID=I1BPU2_RHIO9|nr:hypothetical protein RO3G_02926 [Rhizopus delemar RA 99-880]|eukprot:EIE78222.1 hypothetical protein RO3G_02926 [Rhizopus delemar RA 99-880]
MRALGIRVKIFASVLMRDIGRQFFKWERSPFFGSRDMHVPCQDTEKTPSFSAVLSGQMVLLGFSDVKILW